MLSNYRPFVPKRYIIETNYPNILPVFAKSVIFVPKLLKKNNSIFNNMFNQSIN